MTLEIAVLKMFMCSALTDLPDQICFYTKFYGLPAANRFDTVCRFLRYSVIFLLRELGVVLLRCKPNRPYVFDKPVFVKIATAEIIDVEIFVGS